VADVILKSVSHGKTPSAQPLETLANLTQLMAGNEVRVDRMHAHLDMELSLLTASSSTTLRSTLKAEAEKWSEHLMTSWSS
jgi:hypothetical protein